MYEYFVIKNGSSSLTFESVDTNIYLEKKKQNY